jgi:hypothetical protein
MREKRIFLAAALIILMLVCLVFSLNGHRHASAAKELSETREHARRDWNRFIEDETRKIRAGKLPLKNIGGPDTLQNIRTAREQRMRPDFPLFDGNGRVTQKAVDSLSLTQEEQELLTKLGVDLIAATRKELSSSLKSDPERAKAQGALAAFLIVPFEDKLVESFNQFSTELAKKVDPERAGEILLTIPVDTIYNSFGKEESIGTLIDDPTVTDSQTPRKVVMIEKRDGSSGISIESGRYTDTSLQSEYPGVFGKDMKIIEP